jgi:hypothetical protein
MQESYDRSEKNWALGVTSLASFMMALDSLVITTAFASIRSDFSRATGSGAAGFLLPASRCSCWRPRHARWPARRTR